MRISNLLPYIKKSKKNIVMNLISAIIGNGCIITAPIFLGKAINYIIDKDNVNLERVIFYVIIVLCLYLVGTMFIWVNGMSATTLSSNMVKEIREGMFNKILKVPISYLDTNSPGIIMTKLSNDSDVLFDAISQLFMQLFSGILVVIISLGFMFSINYIMTFVVIGMTPLIYLSSKLVSKKSTKGFNNLQKLSGELNGKVEEFITNQRLVIAYNYQENIQDELVNISDKIKIVGQKSQFYSSLVNPTTRLVNNLTYMLIGLVGSYMYISGKITIGYLTSFFTYAALFSKPFNEVTAMFGQLIQGKAALNRIFTLLDEKDELDNIPFISSDIATKGIVDFSNVGFSYEKGKQIIKDFSISVKQYDKVAIVGPTGAGKSTMINLLMRFYDVDQGEIRIDSKSIYDVSRKATRKSFGLILQDPWLFEGTVKENISYGKKDATLEEVIEVAKEANCHDFIMKLNLGYDTIILENSTNISQGQKQLITIARALLLNPTILILDEATSNIDSLTEKKIQTTFKKVMENHTSFFIAHRLSTVIDSDLIIVMNEGRIIEKGNHNELLAKEGFYYNLYMSQFE